VVELLLSAGGVVFGFVTYLLGRRAGKHSELAIRREVAAVPERTAEVLESIISTVSEPPRTDDPDRGWETQFTATAGFAPVLPTDQSHAVLVEFPYGAHSAVLLALRDVISTEHQDSFALCGVVMNGTGARFHVRESSDERGHEVVTLDYIRPLRDDRPLAEMPTQTVYYRLGDDGFTETGRGNVYDPVEAPWDIPRAVEPFLDPAWVRKQRS
jgi:hypothetical protein